MVGGQGQGALWEVGVGDTFLEPEQGQTVAHNCHPEPSVCPLSS